MIWEIGMLLVILALVLIWLILKIVTTPNVVLTVATDKSTYDQGETVQISGNLSGDGSPIVGETITINVIRPGGISAVNLSATTDTNGDYATQFPTATEPGGTYTVQVGGFGATASTTFTEIDQIRVSVLAV